MIEHDPVARPVANVWVMHCPCGVMGPLRPTEDDALADARLHKEQHRG